MDYQPFNRTCVAVVRCISFHEGNTSIRAVPCWDRRVDETATRPWVNLQFVDCSLSFNAALFQCLNELRVCFGEIDGCAKIRHIVWGLSASEREPSKLDHTFVGDVYFGLPAAIRGLV
jgi:hypothetical protein